MKIEAKDLRDAIATGLQSLVARFIELTGNRGEDPRPEYLTTASLCFSLVDFARKSHPEIRIRAEEMTSKVWAATNFRRLLKKRGQRVSTQRRRKKRYLMRQKNSTRNGNVDITLFDGAGFEHPFAVIENKGILTFTAAGELDAKGKDEVGKDIKRNFEFVLRSGAQGGVQFCAFTFYLRDIKSVLIAEGEAYCREKRQYFERYLNSLNLNPEIRGNVLVDTFDHDLYPSEEAARAKDNSDGPCAHEEHPPWHLAYGIITLYRTGDHIDDSQRLSEENREQLPENSPDNKSIRAGRSPSQ